MRVLFLASYFPKPGNPLMGTWALDQARALQRCGATVEVISLTPWVPVWPGQSRTLRAYAACPAQFDWDGLPVHYPRWGVYPVTRFESLFRMQPARWLRLAWALSGSRVKALAKAFKPDILFAHHTSVNGWVAKELSRSLQVPYVTQDHAQWEIAMCSTHPGLRRVYHDVAATASAMLAVSKAMQADLQAACPQGQVEWMSNGANLPARHLNAHPHPRPPVAFSAGMFVAYKGFDLLLRAWKQVRDLHPEARLRIAGDGPDRAQLHQLREQLGLAGSVEFLGYLTQDQVQAEMAAARLFVLASWNETFGVVFLEAAACATPCIWARNAGIADVLEDGVHGIATTPYDADSIAQAISGLLTHPDRAAALGQAAAQHVESHLTWEAVARQLLHRFSAIIAP
jgi:glycosyltransferase involved in cell wall biosynthesis